MEESNQETLKPSWTQTIIILMSIALAAGGTLFQVSNNSNTITSNTVEIRNIIASCSKTATKIAVIQQVRTEQGVWMRDMVSSIKDMVQELKTLNGRVISTEMHVESLNMKMEEFKHNREYEKKQWEKRTGVIQN